MILNSVEPNVQYIDRMPFLKDPLFAYLIDHISLDKNRIKTKTRFRKSSKAFMYEMKSCEWVTQRPRHIGCSDPENSINIAFLWKFIIHIADEIASQSATPIPVHLKGVKLDYVMHPGFHVSSLQCDIVREPVGNHFMLQCCFIIDYVYILFYAQDIKLILSFDVQFILTIVKYFRLM